MKLSTKGRYGARAALELALQYGKGLVLVRQIAKNQSISLRYLEHILNALRESGLVKSRRGMRGGYELAKPPSEITLGDIVRSVEGPFCIVPCLGNGRGGCDRRPICAMTETWGKVNDAIDTVLDSISLEDIRNRSTELAVAQKYAHFV